MYKRKHEGHTSQIKTCFFSNFKGFHNEHGYISNTAVTDTESHVLQLDVSCYTGEMLS